MMTKAYLESVIERMGEKAEIIIFARDALAYLDRAETAEAERDAVIVERDEAYKQRDAATAAERVTRSHLDALRPVFGAHEAESTEGAAERIMAALAEARRERDGARDELAVLSIAFAGSVREINDARAILGAAAGDLLSDAAERAACAVQHEANAMDIIGRALGRKVVGGADVAAIHASEEIDRLRERVKALVGAERERDRLLRSEADACAILGAAPDELLSDAARRVHNEAGRYRSWVNECALSIGESRHSNVPDRVAAMARSVESVYPGPQVLRESPQAADAREILRGALLVDGYGIDIKGLAIMAADQITAIRAALRWEGEGSCGTLAEHARDVRALLDEAPPQVFAIQHEIAIAGDLVTIRVAPLRDPAIRALPLGVQLGLVVCDE